MTGPNPYPSAMLTESELTTRTINPDVAREAFQQADVMLNDVLDNRKSLEQRAFILLAGFLPYSGTIVASSAGSLSGKIALVLAGAGILLLLASFRGMTYPARGTSPRAWINSGIIDGSESALAHTHAHLARQMADRIDLGISANGRKLRLINAALVCGATSIAALITARVLS